MFLPCGYLLLSPSLLPRNVKISTVLNVVLCGCETGCLGEYLGIRGRKYAEEESRRKL
jgi:hypothetical protein